MRPKVPKFVTSKALNIIAAHFYRSFQKLLNQELKRNGYKITAEHLTVLIYVWEKNGQSQWELAQELFKDKTTIAHLMSGLESQRFIIRKKNRADGREKFVFITKRGTVVMLEIIEVLQKIVKHTLRGITRRELEICRTVLRKAHNNLIT